MLKLYKEIAANFVKSLSLDTMQNPSTLFEQASNPSDLAIVYDSSETYELLKKYRLDVSKEDGLNAYMVFNNEQLDSLANSRPTTKEELIKIKDFEQKKVEKYGESILSIINR